MFLTVFLGTGRSVCFLVIPDGTRPEGLPCITNLCLVYVNDELSSFYVALPTNSGYVLR